MFKVKKELYKQCIKYVDEMIEEAEEAMELMQRSVNNESKSGAGDKYETVRSMMQSEKNKHEMQLVKAYKFKEVLFEIIPEKKCKEVKPGSLVETTSGNYYIAINVGKLEVGKKKYFSISMGSPIAQSMAGKKAGDKFEFRGKRFTIKDIV